MAINETQKLNRLAQFSQKEFWSQGGLLKQTKLGNFILVAFVIHVLVIAFQFLAPAKSKGPSAPPPIQVKYIETQKPDSFEKKEPSLMLRSRKRWRKN